MQPRTLVQVADYPVSATYGPRRLVDYEFVWVLRGSARWSVHDDDQTGRPPRDRRQLLAPGQLALARAGTVDSFRWDEHRASTHAYVHFDIIERGDLSPEHSWASVRQLAQTPILEGICAYLLELAGQQSRQARARSDELVRLLLDLYVSGPLGLQERSIPIWLTAVLSHVSDVWRADGLSIVSTKELADAGHISAGHLFRLFRENFGLGPARVFELVRLARAAILLQRSNAGIAEVAALTGFANAYHFSRRFAAAYGSPPGAFRALVPGPDPLAPVSAAGLLPVWHAVLGSPAAAA